MICIACKQDKEYGIVALGSFVCSDCIKKSKKDTAYSRNELGKIFMETIDNKLNTVALTENRTNKVW